MRRLSVSGFTILFISSLCAAQTAGKRPLALDDMYSMHDVGDPQVSPDGEWVAYTVSTIDKDADKRNTHIWMVKWDGSENLQLTFDAESESAPRWSADGKYLSFLSSRAGKAKGSQVWILDRRGGEARQLTDVRESISEYEWAPDSAKLLLVMKPKSEAEQEDAKSSTDTANKPKPPKPIVIDRYHFKQDVQGYLSDTERNHIYVFDIATKKVDQITTDQRYQEEDAVWSPDGNKIAFVSNQDKDPDRTENTDVFVVDAHAGAKPLRLTDWPGPDGGRLAWSPDSKLIAYLRGSESKYSAYDMRRLAVVPADGGPSRILTAKLDRGVSSPVFTKDGASVVFLVADDGSEYPATVPTAGGAVERLVGNPMVLQRLASAGGHTAALATTDGDPFEIYALEGGSVRKLTTQNDELISKLQLGAVQDIQFKSKDGTDVHGVVMTPPSYQAGKPYPMLLRIHGGPNGQDGHAFTFEHQFFAAHGYVVLSVNYRGSAGRGEKYGQSIFGDWGNKEVMDLLAGVDDVVRRGIADPNRLAIGGWSYGGILTDYTIASDGRFKAAISGAGSANQISMYGVDQYTFQYDNEIGPPWKNPQGWMKVSYAFFKADRIHTPTLFMGGDKDFNVPLIGGEQMYQALKTLGVPTELVIYPGQFHGFTRPSFIKDRYERYLAWYDKYLNVSPTASTAASAGPAGAAH